MPMRMVMSVFMMMVMRMVAVIVRVLRFVAATSMIVLVFIAVPMIVIMRVPVRMAVAVVMFVSMIVIMIMIMIMCVPVCMVMSVPVSAVMVVLMHMIVCMAVSVIVIMRVSMCMVVIVPMPVVMVMMVRMRGVGFLGQHRIFPLCEKRIGGADHHAQHVRLIRQVAGACAVADRFDDDRGDAAREAVHGRSDNARSRWRRHLHAVVGRGNRQSAHHFQRGRGRHRINAVIDVDPARAQRHGRAVDALDIQRIDRQRDADHVNDRIDRADFVKMHPINRDAVDLRFRDGDFFENGKT